jgi:hypothetical protein
VVTVKQQDSGPKRVKSRNDGHKQIQFALSSTGKLARGVTPDLSGANKMISTCKSMQLKKKQSPPAKVSQTPNLFSKKGTGDYL